MNRAECLGCGAVLDTTTISDNQIKCEFCDSVITIPDAVKKHEETISSDMGNFIKMAETALEASDYSEGLNYFNKSLEKDSEYADGWLGKGICTLFSSTVGEVKMKEALTYWKNALNYASNKDAMKKRIAREINSAVVDFYPVFKEHYFEFTELKGSLQELVRKFIVLDSGQSFALELESSNLSIAKNGLKMAEDMKDVFLELNKKDAMDNLKAGAKMMGTIAVQKKTKERTNFVNENIEPVLQNYITAIKNIDPSYEYAPPKNKPLSQCFIATATMGDYNHPTVLQLRLFRDNYLLHKKWGQIFTKYYYKWGPYPASIIEKSAVLKKLSYFMIVKPLSTISSKIIQQ